MKKQLIFSALVVTLLVVIISAARHFDKGLIYLKWKNNSPQHHWSIFYRQEILYTNATFRYENDFKELKGLLEPGYVVFSDLATSYYSAGYLPVYARNVNRHHRSAKSTEWQSFIKSRAACYQNDPGSAAAFKSFFENEQKEALRNNASPLRYLIINMDPENRNLRHDCIWHGRQAFLEVAEKQWASVFQGEFLKVYDLALPAFQ